MITSSGTIVQAPAVSGIAIVFASFITAELTPDEARRLAMMILNAADAASN